MLSIICPIFFSFRSKDIFSRANNILNIFLNPNTEVLFVLGSTNREKDNNFAEFITKKGGKIIWHGCGTEVPSPGELRHIGSLHAKYDILLFWDVDLVASSEIINKVYNHYIFKKYEFAIIPCLYMHPSFVFSLPIQPLPANLSSLFPKKILYIALNTSTILIKKDIYKKIKGFSNNYSGHGFEDFDLLCRLARDICHFTISNHDIISYSKVISPLFYTDFRRHLNRITIPFFLDGIFSLHLYHPISDTFRKKRLENFNIFINSNTSKEHYTKAQPDNNKTIAENIDFFIRELNKRKLSIENYTFFFNNVDHALFIHHPLYKKLYKRLKKFFFKFIHHSCL